VAARLVDGTVVDGSVLLADWGTVDVLGAGGGGAPVAMEVEGALGAADVPDRPATPRRAGDVWKLSSPISPTMVAPITMIGRFIGTPSTE
jgi:hypothetical protein